MYFTVCLSVWIYVCVCVLSITKRCLLSPAVKAHEEEEVGQELTLHLHPSAYPMHVLEFLSLPAPRFVVFVYCKPLPAARSCVCLCVYVCVCV